jgi:tetratricopeptide (TPR) repeat protein
MASVFLSYDHEDSARAAPIAAALEANGHSVWWDRQIHGGAEYDSEIESAVGRSDAVVVLWSEKSIRSAWVRDEAGEGRDRGRLVPVLIDPVKPPMGFRQYQTVDLASWSGGKRIPLLPDLLHAIDRVSMSRPPVPEAATRAARPRASLRPLPGISRRLAIGGASAAAALAGGGIWWSTRRREDPRVQAALDKAQDAIRHSTADQKTVQMLEQVLAIEPNNAKTLGLIALVQGLLVESGGVENDPALVLDAERTARKALSIDPKEPNALLAMFELQGSTLDWIARDRKLREIIAQDPNNITALAELVLLTQATGLTHESWNWNERALSLEPLSADYLGKRALKLFIMGRIPQADKVSDQVRALYPTDEWAWWVRFYIYAFSGRARAAQAMLDGNPTMDDRPPLANLWRECLPALEQPSPAAIAKAREVSIEGARKSAVVASQSVQIMSALGEIDTAFDIANGYLLSFGPLVQHEQRESSQAASWRISTQWMWTPPAAPMRKDARFMTLCRGIGLTDYWRDRGVKPDYQRA